VATKIYLPRSQIEDVGWCGQTCLANAIALYGIPTSLEECVGATRAADTEIGADKDELAAGLKHFGFKGIIKQVSKKSGMRDAWTWVREKLEAGQIVICSINGNYDNGHWILLLQVKKNEIHIWDPNRDFSEVITRKNLFKAWWNENAPDDPKGETYLEGIEVIAMSPRSRLAKRAVEIRRNLLYPRTGELPTDKGFPRFFDDPETK
jgi:ABC-type bacteriocin/lantibiotic exporter with double-glycine peptidase domain